MRPGRTARSLRRLGLALRYCEAFAPRYGAHPRAVVKHLQAMLGSTWLARHPALRAAIVRYRGEADAAAAAAAAAMRRPSVEEAPARDERCDDHAPTTPTTPPAEILISGGARRPRSLGDIAAALRLAIGPVAALHAGTAEPGGEHMCCSRRQAEIVELARAVGAAE
eukprot:COSAG01_NODE_14939_length_1393_cov_1.588099_2_plen_166_part_01